ncbi:ABC transporter ATP-binding protein [Paratissierella segnis]|jgi:ABC-2 type transport system ATP-binding protein|uniref:ABC transporter ATP-binding protein n=1 Tax=Paratissierella segnis TaxID=2763679 RepID=A0A926EWR2_9FIRM|nr:ABC transporter ATP-binding protein [Paratissierella segnis]MBC8587724.1 ABC transporter ATP-binding protein [Paratissierella segnis]
MIAVLIENLSKIYTGGNKAVNDISLAVNQGEVFGFLGPNGAGKTTTIKLLCGMLTPSNGSCRVFDLDPAQNPEKLHQLSGVMTEHAQMYDHLTGLDNLIFFGTLFGMNMSECKKRANALLNRLNLTYAGQRRLSTYSTGMRQRLSLARAMLHSPKILFLDEPTSGLDPESAQNVNTLIQELAASGTTIFLCTHQLRYAQEICTTYGLISEGSLLATGNIEKLRSMVSSKLTVRLKASLIPNGMVYEKTGEDTYNITVSSEDEIPLIIKGIVGAGGDVYHVSADQIPLEEIYFSLIDMNNGKMERENL